MEFSADELLKALTLLLDEQRRQSEEWRRKELEYEKISLAFEKMKKKCGWFDGYYVSRYVAEYSSVMREFDVSEAETINNFEFLAESYIRQDVSEVNGEFGGSWKTYKQALRRRFWRNDFDAEEYIVDEEVEADTSVLVAAPGDYKRVADSADSVASVEKLVGILAEVSENSDATSGLKDISASIGSFLERFTVTTGVHEVPVEVEVQKDDVIVVEAEESSVVTSGIAIEGDFVTHVGEVSDFAAEADEGLAEEGFAASTEVVSAADSEEGFGTNAREGDSEAEQGFATDTGEGFEFAADTEGDFAIRVREGFAFAGEAEGFAVDTGGGSASDAGENSEFTTEAERFAADTEEGFATDDGESSVDEEKKSVAANGMEGVAVAVTIGGSSSDIDGVYKKFVADIDVSSTDGTQEICSCLMTGGGEDVLQRFVIPVLLCSTEADVLQHFPRQGIG
ncbi:hypothetical protein R1sor_010715 [Riccia sorocarpa]|uniref:Uncharacterized protein n=1 Tax=Riccia sorocarpa TaxID=122646 RepID=A0ABD3I0P3_9MARC